MEDSAKLALLLTYIALAQRTIAAAAHEHGSDGIGA